MLHNVLYNNKFVIHSYISKYVLTSELGAVKISSDNRGSIVLVFDRTNKIELTFIQKGN